MNLIRLSSMVFRRHPFPIRLSVRGYHCFQPNQLKLIPIQKLLPYHRLQQRNLSFVGFYTFIAQSTPVTALQGILNDLHQSSGLPWWAIIMLSTLGIRTFLVFPLAVHQHQVFGRLVNISQELGKIVPELNKEVNMARVMYKWDEVQCKRAFRKQLSQIKHDLIIRDNCHPTKTFLLVIFQIPIWIIFSFSLRNLTAMAQYFGSGAESIGKLKTEGILWFPDLTATEPFVLPVLLFFVNLALIELHALRQVGKGSLLKKILLNSSRVIVVFMAVAATLNPSSVTFYWLCSSSFGLCQNILIIMPKVRRFLRIPKTPTESSTPFKDIALNFRRLYYNRIFKNKS